MKAALLSVPTLRLAGCVSPSHLTPGEMQRVVARARELVHESRLATAGEEKWVAQAEPRVSYYFLARPQAQYSLHWQVGEKEELVVAGQGDIFRLEGSRVERQQLDKPPEPKPADATPR